MSRWYRLRTFKIARVLARTLPRSCSRAIAAGLGRASYHRNAQALEALRQNLSAVVKHEQLEMLVRQNVSNFLKMLADYFYSTTASPAAIRAMVSKWVGLEHVLRARERGKGALLLTGHIGNWEMGAILLATEGLPMTIVTLEEPSAELTQWRLAYRQRLGIRTVAVGRNKFSFVEMIHTLRNNGLLAMLVDRPSGETGVQVKMFGHSTEFSSAPALLWQHTQAAVLPAFVLQDSGGGYVSRVDAALDFSSGSDAANTQQVATHFESVIAEHPEQWFQYVPVWKK